MTIFYQLGLERVNRFMLVGWLSPSMSCPHLSHHEAHQVQTWELVLEVWGEPPCVFSWAGEN